MRIFKTETFVVLSSNHSASFKGHLSGSEVIDALLSRYPDRRQSPGYKKNSMEFRGRAAWLSADSGNGSVKNFSFTEENQEFDVWEA